MSRRSVLSWAIAIAEVTASRSRDPGTKVGAVILRKDKSIVSVGYNGFPRAMPDYEEWYANREEKLDRIIHAELNAIIQARTDLTGCSMAVTHPPCIECAKNIIAAGISLIAWPKPSEDYLSRWGEDYLRAKQLLQDCDVDFIEHDRAASTTESHQGVEDPGRGVSGEPSLSGNT